jgi:hypothetical protein
MSPRLAKFLHLGPKEPTAAEIARAKIRELTQAISQCRPVTSDSMPPVSSRSLERELDPDATPPWKPPT